LTTPDVVKKNDQVTRNVTIPINALTADMTGAKAPTASKTAVVSSTTPRKIGFAPDSRTWPSQKTRGPFEMYKAIPSADCGVNFWMPNETEISAITSEEWRGANTNRRPSRQC